MRYIPLTEGDLKDMLGVIGVGSAKELIERQIPEDLRIEGELPIPGPISEKDLLDHMSELAARKPRDLLSFCGAGLYEHFAPSAIPMLVTRGEFATAYTPYQPEIAQGTLQAAFEFQSYVCMLSGMEVANASMYDGASAAAEAMLMAARVTRKQTFVVSGAVHPEYVEVIQAYAGPPQLKVIVTETCPKTGRTRAEDLAKAIGEAGDDLGAVLVQGPNFFGVAEDWKPLADATHAAGGLFVAIVNEATSLGLLQPPGAFGADIVCGEAQGWGLPMQWGGPSVGFFASLQKYVRQMPGRLIGETVDVDGRRSFVVTLATREQHIRRERATSNICTSQQLCALWTTIWLSLFGRRGLAELARANHAAAEQLKAEVGKLKGYEIRYSGPTYNEFVVSCPKPAKDIIAACGKKKVVPGVDLGSLCGEGRAYELLVCVTEMRSARDLDKLVATLKEVA